jgi:hypothetical protein
MAANASVEVPSVPAVAASPLQAAALDVMVLCWVCALVIAVWGAIREARRVDRARRRELATNPEPGPTPGIDRLLDRWAIWALGFAAAGLALLGWASNMVRH